MIPKGGYDYKVDRRYNLYEIEEIAPEISDQVKKQADSVACLVHKSFLRNVGEKKQISRATPLFKQIQPNLHKGVKFREEIAIGPRGTAFLIGKQLALTAAHCVCKKKRKNLLLSKKKIKSIRLVFDFHMLNEKEQKLEFDENEVYQIKNIIAHQLEKSVDGIWYDWAILRLDREVKNREPLKFTNKDDLPIEKNVYMLGHPCGLPMKWTNDAEIQKNDSKYYFEADLDAFEGNSGSPVFLEETQELIGMLVEGHEDFVQGRDESNALKTLVNIIKPEQIKKGGFEKCQKVASLFFLKAVLSSINLTSPPLAVQRIARGLSLEVSCNCNTEMTTIQLGFGKFNISKECGTATCPSCSGEVNPNVIVLSSCQYKVEGRNDQRQKINCGPFFLLDDSTNSVPFDVQAWRYLEFDIKELNPQEGESI